MRFLPNREELRVAVIGMGFAGACVAAALADRGVCVVGIDVDSLLISELVGGHCRLQETGLAETISRASASGRLRFSTDYASAAEADVVLIAVGTPVRQDGSLADEQLRDACIRLSGQLRDGQLVVLKSTVPPGMTRSLVLPLLESQGRTAGKDFGLAFTPERLAEGTALSELRTLPMVVGGLDEEAVLDVADFWHRTLGVDVIKVDSLESAEIVKLADNWWIDLNIALANELAKFCALFDVDVLSVIAAANTIPKGEGNVNILLPSVGVGGSCLTKDPWMVWQSARRRDLEILTVPAAREVNDGMPEYTAKVIIEGLVGLGKKPAAATVAVLGLAFKNNTGDLRSTPVAAAVAALAQAGVAVRLFDPMVDPDQAEAMFGMRPVGSLKEAVLNADCLAVLAHHDVFTEIDFAALPVAPSCLLLDGRAYYPAAAIAEFRALGFVYRGIGR